MLDSVFYMEKNEDYFINSKDSYPYASNPKIENLASQEENLKYVLEKMWKKEKDITTILERFHNITDILSWINWWEQKINSSENYKQ